MGSIIEPIVAALAKLLLQGLTLLGVYLAGRSLERAKLHTEALKIAKKAWQDVAVIRSQPTDTKLRVRKDSDLKWADVPKTDDPTGISGKH